MHIDVSFLLLPIDYSSLYSCAHMHAHTHKFRWKENKKNPTYLQRWLACRHFQSDFSNITKLYSLIVVWIIPTWSHSCVREQRLLHSLSCKFLYWFYWNMVCCHGCLSSCQIYLTQLMLVGENCNFFGSRKRIDIGLCFTLMNQFLLVLH